MKKKILLVEDETLIALNETLILERNGYDVQSAVSGEEAVSLFESDEEFDLVLMDINLDGGMDGTVAAELILAKADIPLIFMSSHTEKAIVEKTEGITSYGYIVKDSGETVMLTSIKMAFRLFEARKVELAVKKGIEIWDKTVNSINSSILLIDTEYRILRHNRAFSGAFGSAGDDLRGERCPEIVHGTVFAHNDCPMRKMKESLQRESSEILINDSLYRIILDPVFDQDGKLEGAVHIIENLSNNDMCSSDEPLEETVNFETLFDIERLQSLQDDFSAAFGVASLITCPDGTPITKPSGFSRFCFDIVRKTERGRELCRCSWADLQEADFGRTGIMKCWCGGLRDAGALITVGGKHIANWLIGQVRDESATEGDVGRKLEEIGADVNAGIEVFRELPVMSEDNFRKITALLCNLARTLSVIAYKNLRQARMIEKISEDELQIKKLLAEKELLLKEAHHRIKNNITSIGSLLSMQLEITDQPEVAAALKDAVGRINSTKILYEKLTASEEYKSLPIRQFIEDIIVEIQLMFPEKKAVSVKKNIGDFVMESERLFPLGIVVNELLTNIYKHAFICGKAGVISVDLLREDGFVRLQVLDDGRGVPDTVIPEKTSSYGLKLVTMLSDQIGGSFETGNRTDGVSGTVSRLILSDPDKQGGRSL